MSSYGFAESVFDIATDDEDQPVEPGPERSIERIIQQCLPRRPDSVDLLKASVAFAHARSQHDES
jgi:hypothetical protein